MDAPAESFYKPLSDCIIKTIKSSQQTVKCKSKEITINGEEMYLRLLAINTYKKVPLERAVSFENAPVPLSFFNGHDGMVSTK